MEPSELLRYVVGVLERLRIRYLVTDSIATIYYGEPRFTNDVDIVVELAEHRVAEVCRAFPEREFYVSEEGARRAVRDHSQFNLIHPASGLKVDLIVPADTPFNRSRFSRGRRVKPSPEYEATFASPEDVILKKMEYHREGGSEKHLRDIAGVLKISGDRLDRSYLDEWVRELGLESIWKTILEGVVRR